MPAPEPHANAVSEFVMHAAGEHGQGLVEYGLLLFLSVLVAVGALGLFGNAVLSQYTISLNSLIQAM